MAQGKKGTGPNGRDHKAVSPAEIASQARAHAPAMIRVLQGIAESPKASTAARVSAANGLLDRGLGKPAQAIAIKGDPDSPVVFNLRLGDGIQAKTIDGDVVVQDALTAPLAAIATRDEEG